jgi:hypothetical protein
VSFALFPLLITKPAIITHLVAGILGLFEIGKYPNLLFLGSLRLYTFESLKVHGLSMLGSYQAIKWFFIRASIV